MQSGLPMSTTFAYAGYPVYNLGRNDLGRLPAYEQVDLNIQHDFRLGGSKRVTLAANITNLFDIANYTGMYTTSPYRSGVTPPNADAVFYGGPWTPQQVVADARARGTNVLDSDFYKRLDGQQGRRAIRFQAKFSF